MGTSAIKTVLAPSGQQLTVAAGSNITVTTNGEQLVISSTAASSPAQTTSIDDTLSVSL